MSNLKSRDDYIFTHIPEGFVVNGKTLPGRNGKGVDGKDALRAEDIALLAEMISERLFIFQASGGGISRTLSADRLLHMLETLKHFTVSKENSSPLGLSDSVEMPELKGSTVVVTYRTSSSCTGDERDENSETCKGSEHADPASSSEAMGNFADGKIDKTFVDSCKASADITSKLDEMIKTVKRTRDKPKLDPNMVTNMLDIVGKLNKACIYMPPEDVNFDGGGRTFYVDGEEDRKAEQSLIGWPIQDRSPSEFTGYNSLTYFTMRKDQWGAIAYYEAPLNGRTSQGTVSRKSTDHYGGVSSNSMTYGANQGWKVQGGRLVIRKPYAYQTKAGKWHCLVSSITLSALTGTCSGTGSTSSSKTTPCTDDDGRRKYSSRRTTEFAYTGDMSSESVTFTLSGIDETDGTCTFTGSKSITELGLSAGRTDKAAENSSSSSSPGDSDDCSASVSSSEESWSDNGSWFAGWAPYALVTFNPRARP